MKDGFGVVFCVVVEKIGGLRLFKMGVFAMVTSEMIGMVDVFGFIFLLFGDTEKEGLIFLGIFRSEKSGTVIEGSIVREGFLLLFESYTSEHWFLGWEICGRIVLLKRPGI